MKTRFLLFLCILLTGCIGKAKQENTADAASDQTFNTDATFAGGYNLGSTIKMFITHGYYTVASSEVYAIVLNPEHLPLTYGRRWSLEKWENDEWITPKMKKQISFFDDEMTLPTSDFLYFSFPIKAYEITRGRYRISKSFNNAGREIDLKAEFEIDSDT